MEQSYSTTTTTGVTRTLRPYEYVATPPIQLVFDAILDRVGAGGSFAPGIRTLADWSGVSRGQITAHLRQLAEDGWILYDGRVITLLRHPDQADESDRSGDRSLCDDTHDAIDHLIDHSDQGDTSDRSGDRSPTRTPAASPLLSTDRRVLNGQIADAPRDRSPDRSAPSGFDPPQTPPMVLMSHEQQQSLVAVHGIESTNGGSGGGTLIDRGIDQHPAALLMAKLGANAKIIAAAFAARPDWTPEQVQARWDYDQERIERSDGRLMAGVFFEALRCGQLAPARAAPIDWAAYAEREGYALGGAPPDEAERTDESPHERARRICPDDASGLDFQFLLQQLARGASEAKALAALAGRGRAA